jgi:hypothetical protein
MLAKAREAVAVLLTFGVLLLLPGIGEAAAQRAERPRITAPPTILAQPASQTALAIEVGPPGSLPNNTFVRLRGLPASVSLTEGYAVAPGSWAVPLVGLPSLKANVPAGVSGRAEVTIHLVEIDGTTLAETKTALVIGQGPAIAPPEPPRAERPQQRPAAAARVVPERRPQQPRPPDLAPDVRQRAERMVASGDRHFEQGNIEAARMFFQRAAEDGLPVAALKMAATYDPAELDRLGIEVQGAIADPAQARKWYERARALGAPEAEERLARIGAR